jgi:hypothetical protein
VQDTANHSTHRTAPVDILFGSFGKGLFELSDRGAGPQRQGDLLCLFSLARCDSVLHVDAVEGDLSGGIEANTYILHGTIIPQSGKLCSANANFSFKYSSEQDLSGTFIDSNIKGYNI